MTTGGEADIGEQVIRAIMMVIVSNNNILQYINACNINIYLDASDCTVEPRHYLGSLQ